MLIAHSRLCTAAGFTGHAGAQLQGQLSGAVCCLRWQLRARLCQDVCPAGYLRLPRLWLKFSRLSTPSHSIRGHRTLHMHQSQGYQAPPDQFAINKIAGPKRPNARSAKHGNLPTCLYE